MLKSNRNSVMIFRSQYCETIAGEQDFPPSVYFTGKEYFEWNKRYNEYNFNGGGDPGKKRLDLITSGQFSLLNKSDQIKSDLFRSDIPIIKCNL